MDAVESVRFDTELFKDVYDHNPYCKEVVQRLIDARKCIETDILETDITT